MSEKKPFIKENIVKKTQIGRGFRRFIIILVSGILIGIIAAVTMVLAKPAAEKFFGEEETTTQEVVIIPRDEVPEEMTSQAIEETTQGETTQEYALESEPEAEPESTEASEEETTKAVEEIVQSAMEDYQYSIDDMTALWKNMSVLCDDIDGSIVTVRTQSNGTDWFDNEISKEGEYSGIVVAKTGYSSIILAPEAAVRDKDIVSIIWQNDYECRGKVESSDSISGLAVIVVYDIALDDETQKIAKPVKLGNSYLIKRGDILIALGSPKSLPHSTAYTWASFVAKNESDIDGQKTLIYTTEKCDSEKGTWFVNSNGEFIGWSVEKENNNQSSETVITGLSEYKTILEKMSNGSDYPYLGIRAIDVDNVNSDTELPRGIYVTEVLSDSPAYQAGIQPGDIVTKIQDVAITSTGELVKAVEELKVSDPATVSVKRNGRDEYVDIDYELTVGKR